MPTNEDIREIRALIRDTNERLEKVDDAAIVTSREVHVIKERVDAILRSIEKLVTRTEFTPVKIIVYSISGSVLSGVVVALLGKVLTK